MRPEEPAVHRQPAFGTLSQSEFLAGRSRSEITLGRCVTDRPSLPITLKVRIPGGQHQ